MFGRPAPVGNNKQVCNFYLKGNCKYGARCWNLHPQSQGATTITSAFSGGGGGGGLFGQKPSTQQDTKDFTEFVKQVSGEMSQWERSGQWLLSSFAPLKSKPPISGFTDSSPEELRVQAYEALKSNSSHTYQTQWSELQQRFKQLREALKVSTTEATQALREVFHAKSAGDQQGQQAINSPSLFGKPSGQTLFGGASAPPSNSPGLLGAKPQSSVFAGNPSVFGGSQQSTPGLFGGAGASSSVANKAVFGGQAALSSSTFGGGGTSGSTTFGNAAQTPTTPSGIFGGSSQGQSSSLFGGASSTPGVAQPNPSNIFGGNPQNIFGRTTQGQPSLFGGMAGSSQGGVFGAAQGTGMFSGAANKPATPTPTATEGGVFGGQQGLLGAHPQQQSSLFGKPPASTPSVFGGSAPVPASTAPLNSGTSIFGGGAAQSTNSVFGGGAASTPTATSGQGMGLFGGASLNKPDTPGTGIFGGAASSSTAPGLFGQPPENPLANKGGLLPTPPASQLQSQFLGFDPAKGRQNVSQVPGGNPVNATGNKAEWYTPLEQLQPHDREEFEADTFTVLPLCAPPLKYCF
ncbi:nuclear pore complex protein Nup98-Nup96-like isoform X2 [Penaeus chinensis]|nr:nuclear pore complex protein Nup98-Nup96-like isoform X2 [Penaeus chinensis]XP_047468935.1 nuclear pore complex protein Nup98-Nup96-like isoform X2 [Penaeus chinensis]XP_047468945.1 nuclear pore complex protein Nup98-Nup96-like isoform X2 [Penaeus chinensis]XP_047468954.1 nuclear pore complex protein Nup98-Nup96-like isoform X2 [Penaeus chinensis]XP_047468962.1 nuclear pore complex protein Nup98-Nup96-like isoform X2 [Penaeus chinensis]XP_047468968.1 nuclear pore complex protein Nup98-Nup96